MCKEDYNSRTSIQQYYWEYSPSLQQIASQELTDPDVASLHSDKWIILPWACLEGLQMHFNDLGKAHLYLTLS